MSFEGFLVFNSLQILLVFNFFLHILVSLEKLIVFILSELQSLVKVALELLLECIHLILLLLNEFGLSCDDLLVSILHVFLSFDELKALAHHLHLMGFGILFLLSESLLDRLLVQKFRTKFEGQRQLFFKGLAVLLNFLSVTVFELAQGLSVFFLGVE